MSYCGQPYLIMLRVSALLCCYAAVHINNEDDSHALCGFQTKGYFDEELSLHITTVFSVGGWCIA
jgi:hypothetical protein